MTTSILRLAILSLLAVGAIYLLLCGPIDDTPGWMTVFVITKALGAAAAYSFHRLAHKWRSDSLLKALREINHDVQRARL